MALTRGPMGTVSAVLLGAAIMFMFFVILGGITNSTPLDKTQFLSADTSSIAGARPVSQWNYFTICGEGNKDCGNTVPDPPLGYAWVGGGDGAPPSLLGAHGKHTTSYSYYYMWRFGWVFYLMGLVFTVFAFFISVIAICSRLASFAGALMTALALFWFTLAASLMTAEFVKARNQFRRAGMSANVGTYAFAFTWTAWACLFLSNIALCIGGASGDRRRRRRESLASEARDVPVTTTANTGKDHGVFGFYHHQRQKRAARAAGARSSFERDESQRRVKDDYA
ncbi:Eisosomes component [Ciborinia camelliae]|nr:Eisosomes component [Ciborinia camelliae]